MAPAATARLGREVSPHAFSIHEPGGRAQRCVGREGKQRLPALAERTPANEPGDESHGEDDRQGTEEDPSDDAHSPHSI